MVTVSRILDHHRPPKKLNRIQRLDWRQNEVNGVPWENWVNLAMTDPTVTALTPSTLPATAASTVITVTGTGFGPGSVVEANGVALVTTYVSPTSLTAPFDPSVAGNVTFTVRNSTGMESNDFTMVITASAQADPTSSWTKAQIIDWLVEKGVVVDEDAASHFTKAELLDIVAAFLDDDEDTLEELLDG